jgi:D-aspartate ligase|nr:ATP-grasp domain-containing protein [Odoribacter splanchnicus]
MKSLKVAFNNSLLKHKFIVFCGDHYNPLTLVRSLGEDGIKPIVILSEPKPILVNRSKYIGKLHHVNSNEEGLKLLINEYGNEEESPFVFTCSDDIESLVDENLDILRDKFYFFHGAYAGQITHFMNKEEINKAAEKCGIRIPKSEVLNKGEFPKNVPYPVITKSIMSIVGGWKQDVFVCYTEEELKEAYTKIKSDVVLVEEYIDKQNELCIDGISLNGGDEVFMPFKVNYLRFTNKAYGNYMTVSLFDDMVLEKKIKKLFEITGFSGIFSIEFLITKDNDLVFLEVNFRHSTWALSSKFGGANLPLIWAQSVLAGKLCTGKLQLRQTPFKAMAELADFNENVRHGNLSLFQWIKDFKNCECTYIYDAKDKVPFYMMFVIRTFRFVKRKLKLV